MTTYRSAVPHGYPCAHCAQWVVPDNRGGWVHVNKSYACRDWANVGTGTYATPNPPPPQPR